MNTNFLDVLEFHRKFGLPADGPPRLLSKEEFQFRLNFLREEVREFEEAFDEENLIKSVDALLDLVYVALGTAVMMGVPWEECWAHVQRANMGKVRARPDGSDSKRGSPLDVVKPEGWEPPDLGILEELVRRRQELGE